MRNTLKELEHLFFHEYSGRPLTLAWMRVFYLGTPASPNPSRMISPLSQCPTDAHAPLICEACRINFASFVDIIQVDLLFLIQHLQLLIMASSSSLLTSGAYLDQKLTPKWPNPFPVLLTNQTQHLLIPRPTMDLDSTLHESLEPWTECCTVSPAAHVSRLLLKRCGIQVACSSSLQNQICWLLQTFLSSSVRPCL